jgi:hypothetical protein
MGRSPSWYEVIHYRRRPLCKATSPSTCTYEAPAFRQFLPDAEQYTVRHALPQRYSLDDNPSV